MIYSSELLYNYSFWSLSWQRSYIFVVCQLFNLVYEWQPIRSKGWKWAETIFKRISLLIIQFSLEHWDNKNAGMCFALSYASPRKTTRSCRGAGISLFPFIVCRIVGAETVSLSQWGKKAGQQSILELTQKRAIHTYGTSFHIISMCLYCRRKPLRQNTQTQQTKAWAGWGSQIHEYFIVMTTDAACSLAMQECKNTNNQLVWSFSNGLTQIFLHEPSQTAVGVEVCDFMKYWWQVSVITCSWICHLCWSCTEWP